MVPPFLAYYGVISSECCPLCSFLHCHLNPAPLPPLTDNASLVQEAYDQCRLYRQYLRTPETGLWRHIVFGENPDPGLWATGECEARRGEARRKPQSRSGGQTERLELTRASQNRQRLGCGRHDTRGRFDRQL